MAAELLEGMYRLMRVVEERELTEAFIEDSGIKKSLEGIGVRQEFKVKTVDGKKTLTNNDRPVDLSGAIRNIENYGDIAAALTDLNVPNEVIESGPVRRFTTSYKERWESLPGNEDIKLVQEFDETGDRIETQTGAQDPTTPAEVQDILLKNEKLAKDFSDKIDAIRRKAGRGDKVSVGTWVKRGLTLGAGVITGVLIFSEILKHRAVMNGCWLVDIRTGEKCKISTLSCDVKRRCDTHCGEYNVCGIDGLSPCFAATTCVRRNASTGVCVQTIGVCNNGMCHPLCTFDTPLRLPPGKRLHCVNVNFWGAAEDFFDSTLGTIFDRRYLMMAGAVALVILAILLLSR